MPSYFAGLLPEGRRLDVLRRAVKTSADDGLSLLLGALRALAVEDGCQSANRPPADMYLLGADRTFAALSAVCDASALAGRELIRQLALAYLTGNGDAHAKNFSILQDQLGEWRVSPVYDVLFTHVYGDATLAMSIGGRSGPTSALMTSSAWRNTRCP